MRILVAAVLCAMTATPFAALAQAVGSADFWLKSDPKNIQGCIGADSQFTRKHTLTVQNGQARLTSPGGINTTLKPVRPDVYRESFVLGQYNLTVVADLAANPKSLTVTDNNLGCRWSAVKQ